MTPESGKHAVILDKVRNLRISLAAPLSTFYSGSMETVGFTYILASKGKRLYTGVTSELHNRIKKHKRKAYPNSFTARYNIDQLVYYERFECIEFAIRRESAIKNMHRLEKIQLIVGMNPDWRDLSVDLGKQAPGFDESKTREPVTF